MCDCCGVTPLVAMTVTTQPAVHAAAAASGGPGAGMRCDSTANVHVDGQGGLDITVLGHGAAGSADAGWTSGRIQTWRLFARRPAKRCW